MHQYTLVWVDKEIVDREGDNFHTFRIHGKVITQTTSLKRVLKAVEEFTEVARGRYQNKSGEIQYAIL